MPCPPVGRWRFRWDVFIPVWACCEEHKGEACLAPTDSSIGSSPISPLKHPEEYGKHSVGAGHALPSSWTLAFSVGCIHPCLGLLRGTRGRGMPRPYSFLDRKLPHIPLETPRGIWQAFRRGRACPALQLDAGVSGGMYSSLTGPAARTTRARHASPLQMYPTADSLTT